MWSSSCPLPERGWFFPPTLITAASSSMRVSREEIFGPVLTVLTFRTPDEALAKANNTPYGLSAGVWTEKGSRAMGMAAGLRAGVVWDNTFNRFDPAAVLRWLRRVRLRPGGWAVRDGGLPGHRRRTGAAGVPQRKEGSPMSHLAVPKTYKLYVGGQVPPLGVGPHLPAPRRRRSAAGQRRPRLPQGRPGRRGRRPQGLRRLVGGDAVQPGPGDLPDRGDAGRPAGRVRRAADPRAAPGRRRPAAEVDAAVDRLVHYAGWTDKLPAVFGSSNPISGPYFSYSAPEPTGVVAVARPDRTRRCSVWSR